MCRCLPNPITPPRGCSTFQIEDSPPAPCRMLVCNQSAGSLAPYCNPLQPHTVAGRQCCQPQPQPSDISDRWHRSWTREARRRWSTPRKIPVCNQLVGIAGGKMPPLLNPPHSAHPPRHRLRSSSRWMGVRVFKGGGVLGCGFQVVPQVSGVGQLRLESSGQRPHLLPDYWVTKWVTDAPVTKTATKKPSVTNCYEKL